EKLERALRIPALPASWRSSFQSLLEGISNGSAPSAEGPPSPGFRPLRVLRIGRKSENVVSLELESADDRPLAAALAGQFIVLRLRARQGEPAQLRNYSLCGPPGVERYRLGIKKES